MKRAALLASCLIWSVLDLSACQSAPAQDKPTPNDPPEVIDVLKVSLPPSVAATGVLRITVSVAQGGCLHFTNFKVGRRTPTRLELAVQGRPVSGSVGCPPVTGNVAETYSDPGSPARTGPFEVFVNGQSYGSVDID
ncbi:hypothetical protein [Deinococcus alpinitundrae]|uniref:hypothetical protein n=1 Tax=Deinococcus alpinitundrae TaxID=468913 RepID=UPI00137956A3|nr:hypothetical protein [Deinococcus alpinitundrae]